MCLCISFAGGNSIKSTVNATTTLSVGYYNYTVAYNQGIKNAGLVLTYNTSSTAVQVCICFAGMQCLYSIFMYNQPVDLGLSYHGNHMLHCIV